jgi:hypothetical protein
MLVGAALDLVHLAFSAETSIANLVETSSVDYQMEYLGHYMPIVVVQTMTRHKFLACHPKLETVGNHHYQRKLFFWS